MNGSLSSIKNIIDSLNDAKLDGSTGMVHRATSYTERLTTFPALLFVHLATPSLAALKCPELATLISPVRSPRSLRLLLEVVVAPPALYLLSVQELLTPPTQVSAQNCFSESSGAFTGEISPSQLKDANVHWVILGHSERRSMFGDTDTLVAEKVNAAVESGLSVIACVGETLEERDKGVTEVTVERQLKAISGMLDDKAWT